MNIMIIRVFLCLSENASYKGSRAYASHYSREMFLLVLVFMVNFSFYVRLLDNNADTIQQIA